MSDQYTSSGAHRSSSPPQGEGHGETPSPSLGDLFSDLSQNVSVLVRQEVELAKAELKETARSAGKGAGLYGGAGIAAHFVLLFLSVAAMLGISAWVGYGWAALVIGVMWAIIAAVLAAVAKKQLKTVKGLPQTSATLKEIPPTFNPQEETP
ncbi:phage holin family protein [Paeniglutamicibacter kerguelensis]|uniref:Membrane protein YqjE n=1 Tax=Paeniglutamicibacter kerguelensis TaxID=254788 RepID=A0ABS4XCR8_9MICC|nr:phage holin family protein [Paeniglutamicibacter kerguelensis]MBP2386249.1 putative membrane protein YqjE [Paeniglutamicibacter kerguelensis]